MAINLARSFFRKRNGNVAIIFALTLPILVGLAAGALNIAMTLTQKSRIQDYLDSVSLAAARTFETSGATSTQATAVAQALLSSPPATANVPSDIKNSAVTSDSTQGTVLIEYKGPVLKTLASTLWSGIINLDVTSQAKVFQNSADICVMITNQNSKHTFRTSKGSQVTLTNCIDQVNTTDWDAVEAADDSYIHVVNGQNCDVGDVHFGDVTPKAASCTFFPDPFAGMTVSAPSSCTQTNLDVTTATTLSPGVYCGGLTVEATTTFNPGVYYIKNGTLDVEDGSGGKKVKKGGGGGASVTNITANGVTFVMTGTDSGFTINNSGTFTISPTTTAVGGQYAGFNFFLDQATIANAIPTSNITNTTVTGSGITYLAGQQLVLGTGANVTLSPASIVADFLLPQGGNLTLTGSMSSTSTAMTDLQKANGSYNLRLQR